MIPSAIARRERLKAEGRCWRCKGFLEPHRQDRTRCQRCADESYRRQKLARAGVKEEQHDPDDLRPDQIERLVAKAEAQIRRDRQAGIRPGVEAIVWGRRSDPVQEASWSW